MQYLNQTHHPFVEKQHSDGFRDDRIHLAISFSFATQVRADLSLSGRGFDLPSDDADGTQVRVQVGLLGQGDELY
jgi:uncharacterized membrane protein